MPRPRVRRETMADAMRDLRYARIRAMRFLPGGAHLRGLVARLPPLQRAFGRDAICEVQRGDAAAQGRAQPAFDGMAAAVSFEEAPHASCTGKRRRGKASGIRDGAAHAPPGAARVACGAVAARPYPRRHCAGAGFDHGRELACAVAGMAGPPGRGVGDPAPVTISARSGGAGRISLQGASGAAGRHGACFRILLIDDVCTTGSTMRRGLRRPCAQLEAR